MHWQLKQEDTQFSRRYAHASVIDQHERIYVLAGATTDAADGGGSSYLNDVWRSADQGVHWSRISDPKFPPRFSPRRGHAATMDSERIIVFVMGGFCGKSCEERYLNDWWSSNGGDIWREMSADAPAKWSPRHGHAAVMTSSDSLLVLGGHDGGNYLNDVWYIQNPQQAAGGWQSATKAAPWQARYGHVALVNSLDSIFVLGGFFADKVAGRVEHFNDVWCSVDGGFNWKLVVKHAPWSGRYQHAAVVNTQDELFIVGGLDQDLQRCSDTWRSKDSGQTWELVSAASGWTPRYEHSVVVDRNDSLYIVGGMDTGDSIFNDVWRSVRTCFDDVHCDGETMVCRDGNSDNFLGLSSPICVHICDRRIFDNCKEKEACRVREHKAVCEDPCKTQKCDKTRVCEVAPRGKRLPKTHEDLEEAAAFCLACDDAKTKFACDKLRQCQWSPGDEACLTKCVAMLSKSICEDTDGRCEWKDDSCDKK